MRNVVALAGSLLLFPILVSGQATRPPADFTAQVDEIFAPLNSREAPGCAVAVGKEGRPLVSRAYGMADLEHDVPNTPGTVFEAGRSLPTPSRPPAVCWCGSGAMPRER